MIAAALKIRLYFKKICGFGLHGCLCKRKGLSYDTAALFSMQFDFMREKNSIPLIMPGSKGEALLKGIFHPCQFQPGGGGGNPQIQPAFCFQGLLHAVKGQLSLADAHQRAGDDAHHVIQEGIAVHLQDHLFPLPEDGKGIDGADGGLGAAPCSGEGGKIMGAQDLPAGLIHDAFIQRIGVMGGAIAENGAGVGRIVDAIGV